MHIQHPTSARLCHHSETSCACACACASSLSLYNTLFFVRLRECLSSKMFFFIFPESAHPSLRALGSNSNPIPNDHLHYPDDIDRTPKETAADKIRDSRTDYNNRTSDSLSLTSAVESTSVSSTVRF